MTVGCREACQPVTEAMSKTKLLRQRLMRGDRGFGGWLGLALLKKNSQLCPHKGRSFGQDQAAGGSAVTRKGHEWEPISWV